MAAVGVEIRIRSGMAAFVGCLCLVFCTATAAVGAAPDKTAAADEIDAPDKTDAAEEPEAVGPMRTWTDSTGKRKTKAALIRVEGEKGHFRLADGKEIAMPLDKLCKADQAWIAKQAAGPGGVEPPRADRPERTPARTPARNAARGLDGDAYHKAYLEYYTRIYRTAYLKVGKKNSAWDERALKLLDGIAAIDAGRAVSGPGWSYPVPPIADLVSLAQGLRKEGCDDPLVFYCGMRLTPSAKWDAALAKKLLDEMQERRYSPILVMMMADSLAYVDHDDRISVEIPVNAIVAAVTAKEYAGLERRFLLSAMMHRPIVSFPMHDVLYAELGKRKDADPWLLHMLLADEELGLSRRARTLTAEEELRGVQRFDPQTHITAAREHLLAAWKLRPDYPEAPAGMMRLVARGGGTPEDTLRLWFDRTVAAQLGWDEAYTLMLDDLDRRGDEEGLYAFGLECLKSGRYDTGVPYQFVAALHKIAWRDPGDAWLRRRDVYARLREFFDNIAKHPQNKDIPFHASQEAYFAYRTQHFDEAAKAFDRAGEQLFRPLFISHRIDPGYAAGRSHALSGPAAARVLALEKADADGRLAEAAKTCRALSAALPANDKARPYFRHFAARLDTEEKFAAGDWVPIQPQSDLAGWSVCTGLWSVDDKGGLVCKTDKSQELKDRRGAILVNLAKVGPRFEIGGHAEILAPESDGSFGAVVGYEASVSFWQCFFHPGAQKLGSAKVECFAHHNPHPRHTEIARSDDFRVQVYDGRVATTVGKEVSRPTVPLVVELDHGFPSLETPFGVGCYRERFDQPPVVVRFTDLKIRKLTAPPEAVKTLKPE